MADKKVLDIKTGRITCAGKKLVMDEVVKCHSSGKNMTIAKPN